MALRSVCRALRKLPRLLRKLPGESPVNFATWSSNTKSMPRQLLRQRAPRNRVTLRLVCRALRKPPRLQRRLPCELPLCHGHAMLDLHTWAVASAAVEAAAAAAGAQVQSAETSLQSAEKAAKAAEEAAR